MIAQSLIYGNSRHNSCVAIIIPEISWVMPWARAKGIEGDFATVVQNPELRQVILEDLERLAVAKKLSGLEKPHRIHLGTEAFSVENGTLTPTQKLKRNEAAHLYQSQIDAMYEELVKEAKERREAKN